MTRTAIETIFSHRTIRKYKNLEVPENIINSILEAGTRASNTGNMQVYSIIVTRDKEIKKELLPLHFGQKMVIDAPILLTFCADFNRFNAWCNIRNANPGYDNFMSFLTATIDTLLVAQNCTIAAEQHGLGICYLGTTTYNADKIIEVLNLPKYVVPITTISIGYPEEIPELNDRLPLQAIVHYEKYQNFDEAELEKFYSEKENSEIYKSFVKEHNLENLAQVFTKIRYTKKDNIAFSKVILEVLNKQGFMNNDE